MKPDVSSSSTSRPAATAARFGATSFDACARSSKTRPPPATMSSSWTTSTPPAPRTAAKSRPWPTPPSSTGPPRTSRAPPTGVAPTTAPPHPSTTSSPQAGPNQSTRPARARRSGVTPKAPARFTRSGSPITARCERRFDIADRQPTGLERRRSSRRSRTYPPTNLAPQTMRHFCWCSAADSELDPARICEAEGPWL